MNLKTGLLAGACVILAVVAAVGWTHGRTIPNAAQPVYGQPASIQPGSMQPASSQPGDYTTANPAYPSSAPPNPTPNSSYVSPQPPPPYDSGAAYQSGVYYADAQYEPYIHRPVVVRPAEEPPLPAYAPAYSEGEGRTGEYRDSHHRRSTRKSVSIVAGSAGVGAAVGALAGGGKGAGIGALAGGAGGFVYDRLTHNH